MLVPFFTLLCASTFVPKLQLLLCAIYALLTKDVTNTTQKRYIWCSSLRENKELLRIMAYLVT